MYVIVHILKEAGSLRLSQSQQLHLRLKVQLVTLKSFWRPVILIFFFLNNAIWGFVPWYCKNAHLNLVQVFNLILDVAWLCALVSIMTKI